MLKSKIHRVRVTACELEYEGSCAIDTGLMRAAGIREYEQLHIYNLANGERFTTYAITAPADSGVISLNGAAAHRASVGDLVIICTYAQFAQAEAERHDPMRVYVDSDNRVQRVDGGVLPLRKTGS